MIIIIHIHTKAGFIMVMTRKTITITDKQENWVKSQIDSGDYGNDSEYFRDLVRRDQAQKSAEIELRLLLDEAQAKGYSDRTPEQIIDAVKKRLGNNGTLSSIT